MSDYYDLGSFSWSVSTTSAEAQSWFNRGIIWCFAYNHEEAIACFEKALRHDPECAMAHWGIAYAVGPNYNMPWILFDPAAKAQALARAYDESRAACAGNLSSIERMLVEALVARYPQREPIEDQRGWDRDFADAMRTVSSS